jgi:hypothetical protein
MDPGIKQVERLDRWLLSLTACQLRLLALIIALAMDIPVAWASSPTPVGPTRASSRIVYSI